MAARTPPSRISQAKILADLRLAAKKGDCTALSLALDRMRTLAHSPRYWGKYLVSSFPQSGVLFGHNHLTSRQGGPG